MEWLIKDVSEELKSWGYAGGSSGELILKSDGEHSIKAVRDAVGRYHGGKIIPEQAPPGETQSSGQKRGSRQDGARLRPRVQRHD